MFLSDDDMVECPYNKTHRMLRKRLQSHLLKCRLHYPEVELRKCPFNITHLIPEPEFTHHATNCPDRKLITQYKYDAPEPREEETPKHAPIECDENWDDTDVNDYNPKAYLENAYVIRKPDGANPSERKLFIKKERKRLGDGDESSEDEDKSKDISRRKQSNSLSTSSYSKQSSRSPPNSSKGERSRSPPNFSRRERLRSPIDYRSRSPPNSFKRERSRSPIGYRRSDRDRDEKSFSSSKPYYSNGNSTPSFYDQQTETMPEAPPPPMISYPAPRSYFTSKQYHPDNN